MSRAAMLAATAALVAATTVAARGPAGETGMVAFRLDPGSVVALGQAGDVEAGAILDEPGDDPGAGARRAAEPAGPLGAPRLLDPYGVKGSTRIRITGGYGVSVKDSSDALVTGGIGVAQFIADDLALLFELNALWFRQNDFGDETDVGAANFNILFQWHFFNRRDWSLFVEGGAGVLVATDKVPGDGSQFNFTPQAGIGATLALSRDLRLVGGVRWHHVSNANVFDDNPGRDSIMGYLGVEFPF